MKDRIYEIAKNCEYDGYQRTLARIVYKCFDANTESGVTINEELAKELHNTVIKKFKRKENSMRDLKTIFGQKI